MKRDAKWHAENERLIRLAYGEKDLEAMSKLICRHMYLCRINAEKIWRRNRGRILKDDLLQEGAVGLTYASKKFKPELGYKFATYVRWFVISSMNRHVRAFVSPVTQGKDRYGRELFEHLGKTMEKCGIPDGEVINEEHIHKIAEHEGCNPDVVRGIVMAARPPVRWEDLLPPYTLSYSEIVSDGSIPVDDIVSMHESLVRLKDTIEKASSELTELQKDLVAFRWFPEGEMKSYKSISKRHGVSRQRAEQQEIELKKIVKKHMKRSDMAARSRKYNSVARS